MPLDVEPTRGGTITVDEDSPGPQATVYAADQVPPNAWPLYRSHFATCPNAAAHRKAPRLAEAAEEDALREMGINPLAGPDVGAK